MARTIPQCRNCRAQIKSSVFTINTLLSERSIALINEYADVKKEEYCQECGSRLKSNALAKYKKEVEKLTGEIETHLPHIPAISISSPFGWDYTTIGLVTAQSTIATYEFVDYSLSIFDALVGNKADQLLKEGERFCLTQLKLQTLALGGNAIMGIDIDYTEISPEQKMLLVCTTGTAVKLKNSEVLDEETQKTILELERLTKRLSYLQNLK